MENGEKFFLIRVVLCIASTPQLNVDNEVTMRKLETLLEKQSFLHYLPTETRKTFLNEIL